MKEKIEKDEQPQTVERKVLVSHLLCETMTTIIVDDKIESVTITSHGSGWPPAKNEDTA